MHQKAYVTWLVYVEVPCMLRPNFEMTSILHKLHGHVFAQHTTQSLANPLALLIVLDSQCTIDDCQLSESTQHVDIALERFLQHHTCPQSDIAYDAEVFGFEVSQSKPAVKHAHAVPAVTKSETPSTEELQTGLPICLATGYCPSKKGLDLHTRLVRVQAECTMVTSPVPAECDHWMFAAEHISIDADA